MKHVFAKRFLSILLVAIMLVSAFAIALPAQAESTDGKVLWHASFDNVTATQGTATNAALVNPTNGDDILPLTENAEGTAPTMGFRLADGKLISNASKVSFVGYKPNESAEYNKFFDLMYGRTEESKYYFDFDFTTSAPDHPTNDVKVISQIDVSKITTLEQYEAACNLDTDGDGKKDAIVAYTLQSYYRGPSYFAMMYTSSNYEQLFKLNKAGYLYGPGYGGGTVWLKSTTTDGNYPANSTVAGFDDYSYMKYQVEFTPDSTDATKGSCAWKTKVSSALLTPAALAEMEKAKGSEVSASWSDAMRYEESSYKIEPGVEYNIRIAISTTETHVTWDIYIRPANANDDAPYTKVGTRTQKIIKGTSGVSGKDYPYGIRVTEGHTSKPTFDNMVIATPATACKNGHHEFPVITSTHQIDEFNQVCAVTCQTCGESYFVKDDYYYYFNCDFTTMTEAELSEWRTATAESGGGFEFDGEKGLKITQALWTQKGAPKQALPFEFSITLNFDKFPIATAQKSGGVSLITDTTSSYPFLLRMGTINIDGTIDADNDGTPDNYSYDVNQNGKVDTTNESGMIAEGYAWLKMRDVYGNIDQKSSDYPTLMLLELNKDYEFKFFMRPGSRGNTSGYYDLYINGEYMGTGNMGSAKAYDGTTERKWRIGDGGLAQFHVKDYYIRTAGDYVTELITDLHNDLGGLNLATLSNNSLKYDSVTDTFAFGADTNTTLTVIVNDENLIVPTTYTEVDFDFKISDQGKIRSHNEIQAWSLLSWLTGNTSETGVAHYGSLIRVGSYEYTDDSDDILDAYFLVPSFLNPYVSEDEATDEEKRHNSYVDSQGVTWYATDRYAIYKITPGEWVHITVGLDANESQKSVSNGSVVNKTALTVYVNGTLVYSTPTMTEFDLARGTLDTSKIRIGDAYRQYMYDWRVNNVTINPNIEHFNRASNKIWNIDFGGTSYSNGGFGIGFGRFGDNPNMPLTEVVSDTATEEGYAYFKATLDGINGGSANMMNLSRTAKDKDGNLIDVLNGEKYAISINFALIDRKLTDEELEAYNKKHFSGDKKVPLVKDSTDTTKNLAGGANITIARLSKFIDKNQARLLYCNNVGMYAVIGGLTHYICDASGNIYDPFTEIDETTGRPKKFTTVDVVVDEEANTYSIYVDGQVAYKKQGAAGKTITYATDIRIPLDIQTGSLVNTATYSNNSYTSLHKYADSYATAPEYIKWANGLKRYMDIPQYLTVTTTTGEGEEAVTTTEEVWHTDGTYKHLSYIRFFQSAADICVQETSITKVHDQKVDYIGSQVKLQSASELTYDLRFVFGIDDVFVNGLQYEVTAEVNNEGVNSPVISEKRSEVYSSILSDEKSVYAYEFCEGEYFSVFTIDGITMDSSSTIYTFTITPKVTASNCTLKASDVSYIVKYNGIGEFVSFEEVALNN